MFTKAHSLGRGTKFQLGCLPDIILPDYCAHISFLVAVLMGAGCVPQTFWWSILFSLGFGGTPENAVVKLFGFWFTSVAISTNV